MNNLVLLKSTKIFCFVIQETVPNFKGGDVRAEESPAPTIASAGLSRPSTQATVKDGILLRWNGDTNSMLRRPRTRCSDGG